MHQLQWLLKLTKVKNKGSTKYQSETRNTVILYYRNLYNINFKLINIFLKQLILINSYFKIGENH